MKKALLSLIAIFAITGTYATANAGVLINASVHYDSITSGTSNSTADVVETTLDGTVGYVLPMGLYLGATYESFGYDDGFSYAGYGPTVGFANMGFYFDLSYLLSVTGTNDTTDYSEGTGILARAGYTHMFTDSFGLGPSISYRDLTFATVETNGIEVPNTEAVWTKIMPMITLAFMF